MSGFATFLVSDNKAHSRYQITSGKELGQEALLVELSGISKHCFVTLGVEAIVAISFRRSKAVSNERS